MTVVRAIPMAEFSNDTFTPAAGLPAASYTTPYSTAF